MSGMISQTNMLKYAAKIGENQAKVGKSNKLVKAGTTKPTQRSEVLTKLRAMLAEHYTPAIAEKALKTTLLTKRDLEAESLDQVNVDTEVAAQGLTGEEIQSAIIIAQEERAKLIANSGASPKDLAKMLMHKLEETPIEWPKKLYPKDRNFVLEEIGKVVDEFVKVHGKSADDLLQHLAQTMADRAGELKKTTKASQFKAAVGDMTATLLQAIVDDGVDAAISGKLTMGNMTRALAPSLQETAAQERTMRFGMVKNLAERMATTELSVQVEGRPVNHSLKAIFGPDQGIWPKLSMQDRETAIRSFMKLHAETHGYPDNVGLVLDHHKDALQKVKYGAFSLEAMEGKTSDLALYLRPLTAQSDDPTHLLTIVAHEMTHAYEYSLIEGTNQSGSRIPESIGRRLAYDIETRKFTNGDTSSTGYAQEQDHYVRDFSERAAVESEWAMQQFLANPEAAVADLVADTHDIQTGFSGKVRTESAEAALKKFTALADEAGDPFTKAKNYTAAAAIALRMGNLEVAAELLPKINFKGVDANEQVWLSREMITELQEMMARPYSDREAKLFALDNLPRFYAADLESTPETERGPRAGLLIENLTRLAAKESDPQLKIGLLLTIAGLHSKAGAMQVPVENGPKHVRALAKLGTQIAGLFDGSQSPTDYKHAHGVLLQLQTDAQTIATDTKLVPKPKILEVSLRNLASAVAKLGKGPD